MISMFKKYWSRLRNKVCPALLSICLISCICSPFASADYSGTGTVRMSQYRFDNSYNLSLFTNYSVSQSLPFVNVLQSGTYDDSSGSLKYAGVQLDSIGVPGATFSSTVSIYFSCFAQFPINGHYFRAPFLYAGVVPDFELHYTDPDTGVESVSQQVGVSTFTPDSAQAASNVGVLLDATISPSDLAQATDIYISSNQPLYAWDISSSYPSAPELQIVSFRVVATDSNATLEGLEAIADQIVAQSEMMQAFYGDIVAVCNQIYNRLGDMQATAELANVYFQQMIALLQSIDSNTVNIYNLLSTQFELLLTAIETSTTDIEAAIAAQTTALIAYFDTVFAGAVGQLPEKSDDLETEIGNVGDAESEYKSNAAAQFQNLSTQFNGFTGGTLSGIALASNLFTQLWNVLGEYSVVYSFPLLLGLSLLLIGRISRYDKAQTADRKRQERYSNRSSGSGKGG